uniref:Uncharacterized protein n=1 Tax=Manihot esculenta TaxID=3983 RepID=A0A2C9VUW3_MANES
MVLSYILSAVPETVEKLRFEWELPYIPCANSLSCDPITSLRIQMKWLRGRVLTRKILTSLGDRKGSLKSEVGHAAVQLKQYLPLALTLKRCRLHNNVLNIRFPGSIRGATYILIAETRRSILNYLLELEGKEPTV